MTDQHQYVQRVEAMRDDLEAALKECADHLGSLPPGGTREPLYPAYRSAIAALAKAGAVS